MLKASKVQRELIPSLNPYSATALECNQECEIQHAKEENIILKLVANLTQSWSFIPLVLSCPRAAAKKYLEQIQNIKFKANPGQE